MGPSLLLPSLLLLSVLLAACRPALSIPASELAALQALNVSALPLPGPGNAPPPGFVPSLDCDILVHSHPANPTVSCASGHVVGVSALSPPSWLLLSPAVNMLHNLTVLAARQAALVPEGQLPALENVTALRTLVIAESFAVGAVPESYSALTRLESVNLGMFLPERGAYRFLLPAGLPRNTLSGPLPTFAASAGTLQELRLSGNLFTGGIPDGYAAMPNLKTLELSNLQLSGVVPPALWTHGGLENLYIENNLLEGPMYGGNLTSIRIFWASVNRFSGAPFPVELLRHPHLVEVMLNDAGFLPGPFPQHELCSATNLIGFCVGRLGLHGQLPPCIGSLPLDALCFHANNITAGFPPSSENLTALQILTISDNPHFGGQLP